MMLLLHRKVGGKDSEFSCFDLVFLQGLYGEKLGDTLLCSALGARVVKKSEIEDYSLAAPKRIVQLISPPPSPPETWKGWDQEEDKPKSPPELVVSQDDLMLSPSPSDSRVRELNILATDLYSAVQQKLVVEPNEEGQEKHGQKAPKLTIEAPPESITGLPEGFVLKMNNNEVK